MKKKLDGFGLIEAILVIVVIIVLVGLGLIAWSSFTNKGNSEKGDTSTTNTTTNKREAQAPQTHSFEEAVNFAQNTYDKYLAALKVGSDYNSNNPNATNKTLPQYGLEAVKNDLSSDLYSKILNDEKAGGDNIGCTTQYLADHFTAVASSDAGSTATINVGMFNGYGENTGNITVSVDISTLLITNITCPNS